MPKMMKLAINPAFRPENADQKRALEKERLRKTPLIVPHIVALEAVNYSKRMYVASEVDDMGEPQPSAVRDLEDMDNEELKRLMLQVGVTPMKQMKRPEIIKAIRLKMDAIEIVDDDEGQDAA